MVTISKVYGLQSGFILCGRFFKLVFDGKPVDEDRQPLLLAVET